MSQKKKYKWGICSKKGWKVYFVYDTKEDAEAHLTNPEFYEVRRVLQ